MSDRYQALAHSPIGKVLVKNLGLPNPPYLDRWSAGDPVVKGTVLVGAAPGSVLEGTLDTTLAGLGVTTTHASVEGERYKGLVFDATGIATSQDLVELQRFFTPVLRSVDRSAHVVVLGRLPEQTGSTGGAIAQRALEGFTRSLGKEIGNGGAVNLVYVGEGTQGSLASTLGFLLSPKSAFVSGQVVRLGTTDFTAADAVADPERPLAGKVALVTGASRGLGAAMARTLHRDGATVVGLDVPAMADDLKRLADDLDGGWLTVDITVPDAPQRIAAYLKEHHGGVDVVVHNAGITRDKRLKNMKPENWSLVVDISVGAPQRITEELVSQGLIRPGGRVLGVSSIAGIAGNAGQTNYGSAKAGVIGLVQDLAPRLAEDGITVNAVAPGFIETDMVKTIPLGIREAGRRLNSMSQGGQPIDVAETVAWLAHPGSSAVSGNVVRVCGQSLLGA